VGGIVMRCARRPLWTPVCGRADFSVHDGPGKSMHLVGCWPYQEDFGLDRSADLAECMALIW